MPKKIFPSVFLKRILQIIMTGILLFVFVEGVLMRLT